MLVALLCCLDRKSSEEITHRKSKGAPHRVKDRENENSIGATVDTEEVNQ